MLPAFAHARRNSRLVAVVSGDRRKRQEVARRYRLDGTPEPSGEEGLQDVRIVQALYQSAETGRVVRLPPFRKAKRPTGRQRITRPGIRKPRLIAVQSASED